MRVAKAVIERGRGVGGAVAFSISFRGLLIAKINSKQREKSIFNNY